MKNIYKIYIILVALTFSSCSKEYLDTEPTDETGTGTVFATTKSAALAVNGLAKMMTQQYLSSQGFNGEGTIKMYYGNYPGNHFFVNLPGWATLINGENNEVTTSIYDYYPWYYYYKIIANANAIVQRIDGAEGPESEKQFIKAQALTFRAYSYMMLAQIYGFRWSDSNNGSSPGLVLRLDESTGDMPLSTLGQTYEQIYADLNEAIALYTASGLKRTDNFNPDINVAYATYARAALNRQDYVNAETNAVKARTGYPLMSNAEYNSGFSLPTKEWIWSSYGASDETLYFYSYFAYIAYNSSAGAARTTPKIISKELYSQIPSSDIRRSLFLNPEGYSYTTSTGVVPNNTPLSDKTRADRPALRPDATVYAYMQFKINAQDLPGVGHLNHFRSSEMYLIEAEAKFFQNKPAAEVQGVLEALTRSSGRDPQYTSTNTGQALLQEIKTYRAIELWGEGFDWFDMKRWGDPIVRKSTTEGGNFITQVAKTITPEQNNRWTWKIPLKETDFNGALE